MSEANIKENEESPKAPVEKPVNVGARPAGSAESIKFSEYIDIFPGKPLSKYDVLFNKAYAAVSKEHGGSSLFALVCNRKAIPRRKATAKYKLLNNPNLAQLIAQGSIFWPPAGEECYVFIYMDNLGKPLLEPGGEAALGWKPEKVLELIVKPMVNVFQDFKDRDFVHGAISPYNMFGEHEGDTTRARKIILGDCFSVPPSYRQTALYEPIERAMADPDGRGAGTRVDDLYALGVSLAVIMRLSDPMKGLSHEEIIRQKIELGTYAAVTGRDRFKGEILELLRGLLHDEPDQRWNIGEVLEWMDGQRLSPKQALVRKKAPRPFLFMEDRYFYTPRLAMGLLKSPTEVRRVIDDDTLVQWLKRSVDDEETAERVEKGVLGAKEGGTSNNYQDRLVTYVSAALDTLAPMRYKGKSIIGDGLGVALACAYAEERDLNLYREIMASNLMVAWLSVHTNKNIDVTGLFTKFEQGRRFAKSLKFGEGLERTLYLMNKECHCLSELFKSYFVASPGKVLMTFEKICRDGTAPPFFIDRHIAAFLMENDSKVIEHSIYDLNSGEKHKIMMANLRILSDIQKRHEVGPVPHVTKAIAKMMDRLCERFYDRELREKMESGLKECADSGDLKRMLALLDDPVVLEKDVKGFKRAMLEYKTLSDEFAALGERMRDKDNYGREKGREWAAIGSVILAALVLIVSAIGMFSAVGG